MIGGYILAEVTKADKLAVKALMDCAEAVKQDFQSDKEGFMSEGKESLPFFRLCLKLDWHSPTSSYVLNETTFYHNLEKLHSLVSVVDIGTQLQLGADLYSTLKEVRKGVVGVLRGITE